MNVQMNLFGAKRLQMTESIELTIVSLQAYGERFQHWAIAWSGGKDSSTLVTLVVYLILAGKVQAPRTLTILYADTRMELLPLSIAAEAIREELRDQAEALARLGVELDVRTVMAPMDKRFLVYILGRGVPPPNNNTLRWCTRQIKIDPMTWALEGLAMDRACIGPWPSESPSDDAGIAMVKAMRVQRARLVSMAASDCQAQEMGVGKLLVLTGVRIGESAVRDNRIATSCAGNGAECGQGWYQETLPEALCDTLAPLLHWRVCHVWEWLKHWAPTPEFGDWTTEPIADAYGGDEAEEINARTGCVGCPLAQEDKALDAVIAMPRWSYLAPLKGLRTVYRWLRTPPVRLRKPGGETRADGSLVKNQQRMGPITLEGRRDALAKILAIQAEVNAAAERLGRPKIDILNAEEIARIEELIAAGTWPQKWAGDEPTGDVELDQFNADGSVQPLLWRALEQA